MFVSKKKYDSLLLEHDGLREYAAKEIEFYQQHMAEKDAAERKTRLDLTAKIRDLEEQLEEQKGVFANENQVVLQVDDSLTKVTPMVKVKESTFEKMVELHYLNDTVNSETKAMAMQIALMMIAQESLDQIIDSFAPAVDETD